MNLTIRQKKFECNLIENERGVIQNYLNNVDSAEATANYYMDRYFVERNAVDFVEGN